MTNLTYVLKRDHDGEPFPISEYPVTLEVGRDRKKNDVVTDDPMAGPSHFFIYQDRNGKCYLVDRGLGTVVNRTLVQGDRMEIENGAEIAFKSGNKVMYTLKACTQVQQGA